MCVTLSFQGLKVEVMSSEYATKAISLTIGILFLP